MMRIGNVRRGPLVTIVVCTYNRRQYLPDALRSALRQDYSDIEVVVLNDGGEDVRDIVEGLNDDRLKLHQRQENRGYAASLNEAIEKSSGKYIAYLDDDDLFYPHHVRTLVDALEGPTDCELAYGDLYQATVRIEPDGSRRVLSKSVTVSRDFDRFFEFYFNQVLHVSLMHTRRVLEKTGLYNEQVRVLCDWDLNRRMAFYSDFLHVHEITGEFYVPINQQDRISSRGRKDPAKFIENTLTIKAARPPKPWPKVPDLSILMAPRCLQVGVIQTLSALWRHTFMPYLVYVALPEHELRMLQSEMPGLVPVPVSPLAPTDSRLDAALRRCEGDYVAVLPDGLPIADMWVERPLHAMIRSRRPGEGYLLNAVNDRLWGAVLRKDELVSARRAHPELSYRRSVERAGFTVRHPRPDELPFIFDEMLRQGILLEREGSQIDAFRLYEANRTMFENDLWMRRQQAWALFRTGNQDEQALELCGVLNSQKPTPDTLLLEAKLHRRANRLSQALSLLRRADGILEWKG